MVTIPARPLWHGRALAVFGIALMAFSMRSAVASLSPMLRLIERTCHPGVGRGPDRHGAPLCFAVVGMLTPALERRFGLQRLAVVVLAVVTVGLVARAFASSAWTLLAGHHPHLRGGGRRQCAAASARQGLLPRSHRAHGRRATPP